MNTPAKAYIGLVILVGSITVAIATVMGAGWVVDHSMPFLALVLGIFVCEWFVINLSVGNKDGLGFSIGEMAITIGLLSVPAGPIVLATVIALAGAQLALGRGWLKSAFNVAMYAISSAAAAATFAELRFTEIAGPHGWIAAIMAMAAFYVCNQILLSFVVSFANKRPVREIFNFGGPLLAVVWLGNVVLGMLGLYLAMSDPTALPLLIVPVLLTYFAYRGRIHAVAEGQKMRSLYEVGASLLTSLGNEPVLQPFLQKTKELFRAEGAEIVTFEGSGAMRVIADDGSSKIVPLSSLASVDLDPVTSIDRYVISRSWEAHYISRLASEVGVAGALIVHSKKSEHFADQDEGLLHLLANEVSIALRNIGLFGAISEERSKLADIVEHTSDGIYQVSTDRRIITWNPAMEKISGYSAAEAVGQMCSNVLRARDEKGSDMCVGDCPILAAAEHLCHQSREARITTKAGDARWIAYSHSPVFDPQGKMRSDVVVVRDVTAQKAAQELKDDFVATVSHELRTPITPIKGFLATLLREDVQFSRDEIRGIHELMLKQSNRLEYLVKDLLDAGRLESGQVSVELTPVDLNALVDGVIESYRVSDPGRELIKVGSVGPHQAIASAARLEQVINNLVQNALRYAPDAGPIEFILSSDGQYVSVAVRDEGPGIPFGEQERIFERFYRSGHHLTREPGGTGLGLYISRRLTEAMGGKLSVISRPGQGATFSVQLQPSRSVRQETLR